MVINMTCLSPRLLNCIISVLLLQINYVNLHRSLTQLKEILMFVSSEFFSQLLPEGFLSSSLLSTSHNCL